MDYFKKIYEGISTTVTGMKITLDHLGGKKVTNQYPEIYHPITSGDMPTNARNRLFVDMSGCDGCDSCAKACPISCITVETVRVSPDDDNVPEMNNGKKRKMWVTKHEIDFAKCCFCSLCTLVCPTEAIYMTQEFEYSEFDREKLKYNFSNLTAEESAEKIKMFEEYQQAKKKEQEEKKKAEAEAKRLAEIEAKKQAEEVKPAGDETPVEVKPVEAAPVAEEPKVLTPEEEAKQKEKEARRAENERKRAERLAAAKVQENG
jgi:NADH-quinone oxidoreductase subunit I